MSSELNQLACRAQVGDEQAKDALAQQLWYLGVTCRKLQGLKHHDREDIVQEALLGFLAKGLQSWQPEISSVTTYFTRILKNKRADWLKHQKRGQKRLPLNDDLLSPRGPAISRRDVLYGFAGACLASTCALHNDSPEDERLSAEKWLRDVYEFIDRVDYLEGWQRDVIKLHLAGTVEEEERFTEEGIAQRVERSTNAVRRVITNVRPRILARSPLMLIKNEATERFKFAEPLLEEAKRLWFQEGDLILAPDLLDLLISNFLEHKAKKGLEPEIVDLFERALCLRMNMSISQCNKPYLDHLMKTAEQALSGLKSPDCRGWWRLNLEYLRGCKLYDAGHFVEALETYKRVESLVAGFSEPTHWYYQDRALPYLMMGYYREARRDFQAALSKPELLDEFNITGIKALQFRVDLLEGRSGKDWSKIGSARESLENDLQGEDIDKMQRSNPRAFVQYQRTRLIGAATIGHTQDVVAIGTKMVEDIAENGYFREFHLMEQACSQFLDTKDATDAIYAFREGLRRCLGHDPREGPEGVTWRPSKRDFAESDLKRMLHADIRQLAIPYPASRPARGHAGRPSFVRIFRDPQVS